MGQLYLAAIVKEREPKGFEDVIAHASAHDFGEYMKLIEHSETRSRFVNAVCKKMCEIGKCRVIWAGEYSKNGISGFRNLYDMLKGNTERRLTKKEYDTTDPYMKRYFVNHDKKQYIDTSKLKLCDYGNFKCTFHPVPLMCCDGNGQGGGDYYGTDIEHIGTWRGDLVELTDIQPSGCEEITPQFMA